jgi:hypothetical protein
MWVIKYPTAIIIVVASLLITTHAIASSILEIDWEETCTLDNLPDLDCEETDWQSCPMGWISVIPTQPDYCVPTGACVFEITEDGLRLDDALFQMLAEWTCMSMRVEIEVDIISGAGIGCTRAYLYRYHGEDYILAFTSNNTVDEVETLRLPSPFFTYGFKLLISSPDVEILEIRISIQMPAESSTWSTVKSIY